MVDRRPVVGVQEQLEDGGSGVSSGARSPQPGVTPTHLDGDHHHQTRLHHNGEGLVVGDVLAVVPDRVLHGGPGDEEEDEGAVGAVQETAQEGPLAEVHVQLAGPVKLRMLETPAVVHVLRGHPTKPRQVGPPPSNPPASGAPTRAPLVPFT